MSRLIKKRFPIEHNLYGRAVTFLYGSTRQINAAIRRELGKEHAGVPFSCLGYWFIDVHSGGYETDYICLIRQPSRREELPALAHEALHHTGHALRGAGMEFSEATEEAYCYYQMWIISRCLEAIAKGCRNRHS